MKDIIRNDKRHELNRPITGVIQEDRIWEQWYDPEIFGLPLPKMTQKDYLFKCVGDMPDRTIINNRGLKKYSVSQFKKMIEQYERAFAVSGLQKGDIICTIGLTTPEMYALKYSATSLGLITCNLNVLDVGVTEHGQNKLYQKIRKIQPKMIFTLDYLEDKIYPVINNPKFDDIIKVSMPLANSTPIINRERMLLNLKAFRDGLMGKKINRKMTLNDFLSMGRTISFDSVEEVYEEGLPCNISFTSGTTGENKAVLLSHDANNALAFQQKVGKLGFQTGDTQLALIPPFLAFWDADVVHAALCVGGENILELKLTREDILEYFRKYDVNVGIWPQYLWNGLLKMPKEDLVRVVNNIKFPIIGGERCEINAAETFYNVTGIRQMTGYGASEINTTFSFTHPYCNKIGSAGIPLPYNNVKIIDENNKDLTYNKPGRLLITGPCLMNGYYKRDDLTSEVFYFDEKGTKWYITGDYATIDMDGSLTVLDRYKEPIVIKTKEGPEKVNILDIAEVIKSNRNVRICKMTNCNDKLLLHLVVDDFMGLTKEEAVEDIISTIKEKLPEKYWPDYICLSDELPRTSVGKVDYGVLKDESENVVMNNESVQKLTLIKNK